MPKPPSAAKPDLASAMWPHLSRAVKAEGQRKLLWQKELKERSKRTSENLQATIDAVRRDKGQ